MAKVSDATKTRMQELGSAWVFKRAIQDNKTWTSWQDIKKDPTTFNEIKKIWKTVGRVDWTIADDKWLDNFYKQQQLLIRKIGRPNFTEFSRDGGPKPAYILPGQKSGETFMDWVSKYVGDKFQIAKKDNWNPADIWLIQNEDKWKRKIVEAMKTPTKTQKRGAVEANLIQFNNIFRALFRSKQIVGISLKKIGGTASWKEVNVSGKFFKNLESIEMKYMGARCKTGTKLIDAAQQAKGRGTSGLATVETQDTVLMIKDNGTEYTVQIKALAGSKFDNLKFEPTQKGKGAARMGKATREYVIDLMEVYGILRRWPDSWKDYPTNKTEFTPALQKQYQSMLQEMKSDRVDIGDLTPLEGVINIRETLGDKNQAWVANSKLMQIKWLYAFLTLSTKNRNKFCTDLIFLAEKAGRRYGPYGKIY